MWVKLLDVEFLGESLRKAYEEVVEAASELRLMSEEARLTFEYELASIEVDIG